MRHSHISPSRRGAPGHARRARPGTSLVELVVVITLLALGAGALAASARVIARLFAAGRAWSTAALASESTLERLRASPCPPSSGTASSGAVAERWQPTGTIGSAVEVEDAVDVRTAERTHTRRLRTVLPCVP